MLNMVKNLFTTSNILKFTYVLIIIPQKYSKTNSKENKAKWIRISSPFMICVPACQNKIPLLLICFLGAFMYIINFTYVSTTI